MLTCHVFQGDGVPARGCGVYHISYLSGGSAEAAVPSGEGGRCVGLEWPQVSILQHCSQLHCCVPSLNRVTDSSSEAFILRLYREANQVRGSCSQCSQCPYPASSCRLDSLRHSLTVLSSSPLDSVKWREL